MALAMSRAFAVVVVSLWLSVAEARTVRLFAVGNSFSQNATAYLPDLAKAGGHELIFATAQTGGCSFERHWKAVEADLASPDAPAGKIYGGKSLREIIGKGTWDIVTIQQYSMMSSDIATYRPYARKLRDHLKTLAPKAEVVVHQTWAYRTDAARFGQTSSDQRDMWTKSRAAYREIAKELGARVIPSGDAFWRIDSDSRWAYKPDTTFDFKNPTYPALPDQARSLHVGYRWDEQKKFVQDANHASAAGRYLAASVWYGFLFGESPEKLTFVPAEVPAEFAAQLRTVAWKVVRESR